MPECFSKSPLYLADTLGSALKLHSNTEMGRPAMELESGLREAVALASSGAMGALLVWGYQKSIKKERLVKLSRRLGRG